MEARRLETLLGNAAAAWRSKRSSLIAPGQRRVGLPVRFRGLPTAPAASILELVTKHVVAISPTKPHVEEATGSYLEFAAERTGGLEWSRAREKED